MAKANQYKSKWRTFSPQATVWVQNVLNHDVEFQVADELNRPYKYKLPQGKVSELPGGKVAELGVKAVVDEVIQNSREHARIWEAEYRSKVEKEVILKVKEAPRASKEEMETGVIDLSFKDDSMSIDEEDEVEEEVAETVNPAFQPKAKKDPKVEAMVSDIAQASVANLPATGKGVGDESK